MSKKGISYRTCQRHGNLRSLFAGDLLVTGTGQVSTSERRCPLLQPYRFDSSNKPADRSDD